MDENPILDTSLGLLAMDRGIDLNMLHFSPAWDPKAMNSTESMDTTDQEIAKLLNAIHTIDAIDTIDAVIPVDSISTGPMAITSPTITSPTIISPSSTTHIRQLADLNVALFEQVQQLPPVTSTPIAPLQHLDQRLFAVDQTFRMTQTLIDLLRQNMPDLLRPASFLLVLSCAHRIFDIYETIFAHMRGCILHHITPVCHDGRTIRLPPLYIGSFSPPPQTAMVMQMLLVVMMAADLFRQLRILLETVAIEQGREQEEQNQQQQHHNYRNTVQRAEAVAEEIGQMRKALMELTPI